MLQLDGAIAATTTPPQLTEQTKQDIRALQQQGKKVMISFGGETISSQTYARLSGQVNQLADELARFVKENDLDGIDIDWEDTAAFMGQGGYDGVAFLVEITRALRQQLPASRYLISHAPQSPYLDASYDPMSGYIKVMAQAGNDIDLVNVQFYNNPPWSGDPGVIVSSYQAFAKLPNMGTEKLLVGLPANPDCAGSGYIPPEIIAEQIIGPLKEQGGIGGAMNWQFSGDPDGVWAETVASTLERSTTPV